MIDVSIVLCAYNERTRIADAIRSVYNQTLDPERYELIVVDDGSTDGTAAVVDDILSDAPFDTTVLRNEENQGLVVSANRGIKAATGQYVVRLDGDDSFAPSALQRLVETATATGSDFVYADRYELDEATGQVTYVETVHDNLYSLVAAGTLLNRKRVTEVGGYRDLFWEEYDLYIRYLEAGPIEPVHVEQPLMVYLRHRESMTGDDERVREGWDELVGIWGKETLSQYGTLPEYITQNES